MPKYTLAISTLNDGILNYSIPDIENINKLKIVLIHQISEEYRKKDYTYIYSKLIESNTSLKIITSYELGLSRSRNLAIKNSHTKYIIFSDDDNSYVKNLINILDEITAKYSLEIYSFRIISKDGEWFKNYSSIEQNHNERTILRLSSIENLFDLNFIKENKIFFNENFGLGAKYPSCEQPIFAKDILLHKGNGKYFPIDVAIHPKENSGDTFYYPLNAKTRRKMFLKVFGKKGYLLTIAFYIKKIKSTPLKNQLSFFYGMFIK